jgi:glutamyl/glutaminyl-tRNA synthetase
VAEVHSTLAKELGVSIGELFNTSRYLVTGSKIGAPVPDTFALLGKEMTLNRMKKIVQ